MSGISIKRYRWSQLDLQQRQALLERSLDTVFDARLRADIDGLIEDVRERGDRALLDALKRFDSVDITAAEIPISKLEFRAAYDSVSTELIAAMELAIELLQRFSRRQLAESSWREQIRPGLTVGEQATAISSAGLFVPSGKGSFPSTLIHLAVPALVAGVKQLAVVVPPVPGGSGRVDPAVLVAADLLGLEQLYRVNGPAGVAALAFGTETIPRVRKVVGPGSPAVQIAQIEVQRFGCLTEMLMGPSESMIIADASADPYLLAADLLIEAEHGLDSSSVLVTDDAELIDRVELQLNKQLAELPDQRCRFATAALTVNGGAVLVDDLKQAYEVANLYAPEHLQLVVSDSEDALARVVHAGEILIGQSTPSALANYVLGVPHALPTGRFARVNSGITARTFIKHSTLAEVDQVAFKELADAALEFANHEGFPAHAAALSRRLSSRGVQK